MYTLAKHIEALLVRNNCVVVPGLGGFVAQMQPAFYDEQDGCYVPPKRSVTFNSILSINDGLLIERYQMHDGLTYYEANRIIAEHVKKLKEQISEEGKIELTGIGTLSSNGEHGIKFTPHDTGLMTPELYALNPVFTEPAQRRSPQNKENTMDKPKQDKDNDYYVIRLNRKVVNTLAAAIVAVMFYFLVIPTGNIMDPGFETASMFPTEIQRHTTVHKNVLVRHKISRPQPPKAISKPQPTPTIEEEKESAAAAPAITQEKRQTEYVIVMASAISKKNAAEFVNKLQKQGHSSARILENGKMRRVVMGHFDDEAQAYNFLRNLTDDEAFSTCWVMKAC